MKKKHKTLEEMLATLERKGWRIIREIKEKKNERRVF